VATPLGDGLERLAPARPRPSATPGNQAHDDYVVRGDGRGGRFRVLYYRGVRLVAADVVSGDFSAGKAALARAATVDPVTAASTPLKSLVVA